MRLLAECIDVGGVTVGVFTIGASWLPMNALGAGLAFLIAGGAFLHVGLTTSQGRGSVWLIVLGASFMSFGVVLVG